MAESRDFRITPRNSETAFYKIVFGGKLHVGKTTLFKYLKEGKFVDVTVDEPTSSGLDVENFSRNIDGSEVKISLWDTAGLETYDSLTKSYFQDINAIILVFRLSDTLSLEALNDWMSSVHHYTDNAENLIISLWAHEYEDGWNSRVVPDEDVQFFATEHNIPQDLIFTVNAKTGENVSESFDLVVKKLHNAWKSRAYSPSAKEVTKSIKLQEATNNVLSNEQKTTERGSPNSVTEKRKCSC